MPATKDRTKQKVSLDQLEGLISKALRKINGNKENDICKYLPHNGGYMHHFTLRKMKTESPEELSKMIDDFIMDASAPKKVPHKPRRPRGSRKRPDVITLSREELERTLGHVRMAGDHELAGKFSLQRSLAAIKKALIASIRQNKADHELWNAFVEASKPHDADASNSGQNPVVQNTVQII